MEQGPDLFQFVIYRCIVGSHAYGLASDESDVDRRGIYLPPAELHWSLASVPAQIERRDTDEVYWELERFIRLGIKANPNILECLYTPLVEVATPIAEELLGIRSSFLSQLIFRTYDHYVHEQFSKIERTKQTRDTFDRKDAMHLIRLLLSGITIARDEFVPLRMDDFRDRLLAIRQGDMEWEELNKWRLTLHKEFARLADQNTLPPKPDLKEINDFLVRARLEMVKIDGR